MGQDLSMEELAARTGEPVKRLTQWQSLGLIGRDRPEGFELEDVERARLIRLLLRRRISLQRIADAERERRFLSRSLELVFPRGVGSTYTLAEAAEVVGLELDLLRRFWEASGSADQGEMMSEEDIEAMKAAKVALDAGFPEEALLQLLRVYADAVGRAAEAAQRLFHFYVYDRLRATGAAGPELLERIDAVASQTQPLVEPAILYFHRKAFTRALLEDTVVQLAEDAGLIEEQEVPGQLRVAIVFADLCSFTPLAEAMGDLVAAQVLLRFSEIVRQSAGRFGGRVVKQIGDAFMLVFPEPRSAVACALEIETRAAGEPQFPAVRSGVHWGTVLYREGDYIGSNVNIASRLVAEAQRHQVLVTAEARKEAQGLPDVEFIRLAKRRLKGLADELELFEVRPRAAEGREKMVDPVCGMELGPAEVAAMLALEGKEQAFCSEECLRRFVAAPERYSA